MARPRVLITRPEPLAGEEAALLQARGAIVVRSPFLSIEPVNAPRPTIEGPCVLALTSRMTFPHLMPRLEPNDPLLSLRCYCVGQKTAEEARRCGWSDLYVGPGQGAGLARAMLDLETDKPAILHIGAQETDGDMAMILSRAGYDYVRWPVYRSVPQTRMPPELADLLRAGEIDTVFFYSARTAKAFVAAVCEADLKDSMRPLTVLALSEKVAAPLRDLAWKRLAVAARPDQTTLVDLFQSTCL